MPLNHAVRRMFPVLVVGLASSVFALPATAVQPAAQPRQSLVDGQWADLVWKTAAQGDHEGVMNLLERLPNNNDPAVVHLRDSVTKLKASIESRENKREERIAEVSKEFDEHLVAGDGPIELSKSLRSAVELYMLYTDKGEFMREDRTRSLILAADAAAKTAENDGNWLTANELFYRLNVLLEDEGRYKRDLKRQEQRLGMIRIYAPERFWGMRNDRRIADGEDPLPPYNDAGDSWQEKLEDVSEHMVLRALTQTAHQHVEKETNASDLIVGGLAALHTLVATQDLTETFPGLARDEDRNRFLDFVLRKIKNTPLTGGFSDLVTVIEEIKRYNGNTVRLPWNVVLREFGDGAMGSLSQRGDDFSAIIWPDEMQRFRRNTQARFVGVGIQIQLDELSNIMVVTPLEGTPAQHAGIHAGDIIKKVDGKTTAGFALQQAVEVITGPQNTKVVLTVEREGPDGDPIEVDVSIKRALIDIKTVKGWRRSGVHDDDWNWFIDQTNGIGYIRLTQFADNTTAEFDRAVNQMEKDGLQGLIVDLRHNPGGLLDEAVSISNRFIDRGRIVSTEGNGHPDMKLASRRSTTLAHMPVIFLVNEGSASASEIVSGAIQDHATDGEIQALLLGQRTFGKGSVQNVWQLPGTDAAMKLTTQHYILPNGRRIHRTAGRNDWGVEPNFAVEMLPEQIVDALVMRRDSDVIRIDENGDPIKGQEIPDPDDLINEGLDLQLQYAVTLLQSQTVSPSIAAREARMNEN